MSPPPLLQHPDLTPNPSQEIGRPWVGRYTFMKGHASAFLDLILSRQVTAESKRVAGLESGEQRNCIQLFLSHSYFNVRAHPLPRTSSVGNPAMLTPQSREEVCSVAWLPSGCRPDARLFQAPWPTVRWGWCDLTLLMSVLSRKRALI